MTADLEFSNSEMVVLQTLMASIAHQAHDAFMFAVKQELRRESPPYGEGRVHRAGVAARKLCR